MIETDNTENKKICHAERVLEEILRGELAWESMMLRIECLKGLNLYELQQVFDRTINKFRNELMERTTIKDCLAKRKNEMNIPDLCFVKERRILGLDNVPD